MKRYIYITTFVVVIFAITKIPYKIGNNLATDNMGNLIDNIGVVNSIISLSPTHTENLFFIGAGDLIVGVDDSSIFPYEATKLESYNIKLVYDLNQIIKKDPDIVLTDPDFISNRYVLSQLESNGIKVVALMPDSLEEFDSYIRVLGGITGRSVEANSRLREFKNELNRFKELSNGYTHKKALFVESSERGYTTPSKISLIGRALSYAGVDQIAPKKRWFHFADDKRVVGLNYIEKRRDKIDKYISLKGIGFSGASIESIRQKREFRDFHFVKSNDTYEFQAGLISRYTFRYIDGIKELNRIAYGTNISDIKFDGSPITRLKLAKYLYDKLNIKTFTVFSPSYYENRKFSHTYGSFIDVKYDHRDFNIIESVVNRSYLLPIKDSSGNEYFYREKLVTKSDLEHFFYIYMDIRGEEVNSLFNEFGLENRSSYTLEELDLLLKRIKEL